jgi:hypothetical protein
MFTLCARSGSLRDKDLNDSVVPKNMRIDSEYLQTLLVVVPLQQTKVFLATYESFAQFVVPRCALEVRECASRSLLLTVIDVDHTRL